MLRYFVGFMISIGLLVVLILLLFHGGSKPPVVSKSLDTYANTDAEVRLTIDGPITSPETPHQQVRISVNRYTETFEVVNGYNGQVINRQDFNNTQASYGVLLRALDLAGFEKGNNSHVLADERGYCPLGNRYIFELIDNGQDVQRYWATNCGGTKTYRGNVSLTLAIFEGQIPGYSQLIQGVKIQ